MKKRFRYLLAAAVLSVSLAGCSSASGGSSYAANSAADSYPEEAAYGIADYEYKTEDAAVPMPAAVDEDSGSAVLNQDKMVYRGSLSIETLEYAETVKNIKERIRAYNGIVEAEEQYDNDRTWYNSGATYRGTCSLRMTIRIPTESFEAFLDDMSGSGKVTSRTTNVENISRRYNDNDTAIAALEKQEARLLEMMDKAETIEDMIIIEQRLTEVQTELNQKRSYRSSMDTDVNYSTIYLDVREVLEYTPTPEGQRTGTFLYRLQNAFRSSWNSFLWLLESLLFLIIHILPWLIIILPCGWLLRRFIKKNDARKADGPVRERTFPRRRTMKDREVLKTEETEPKDQDKPVL